MAARFQHLCGREPPGNCAISVANSRGTGLNSDAMVFMSSSSDPWTSVCEVFGAASPMDCTSSLGRNRFVDWSQAHLEFTWRLACKVAGAFSVCGPTGGKCTQIVPSCCEVTLAGNYSQTYPVNVDFSLSGEPSGSDTIPAGSVTFPDLFGFGTAGADDQDVQNFAYAELVLCFLQRKDIVAWANTSTVFDLGIDQVMNDLI